MSTLPPPKPVLPKPSATHYFEIDPDSDIVGYVQRTPVGKDDTLPDIARRFDVGYEEMLTANPGVDPWLPGVGREVVVPTQFILPAAPREGVVVNVAEMRIFYYPPHKKNEPAPVYTNPIGTGKDGWKTPEAAKIISHQRDLVWVVPKSVREGTPGRERSSPVPAGLIPWASMRFVWDGQLRSGTNNPAGWACLKSWHAAIETLRVFESRSTRVTVVNQPYLFDWRDGALLQAYAVMEDDSRNWTKDRKRLLAILSNSVKDCAARCRDRRQRVADLAHTPRACPCRLPAGTTASMA